MSPAKIHGAEHALQKIFSDDFVFTVPAYQRPYSWTAEEAGELLEDLLTSLADSPADELQANPYFLGSVVLIKGDAPDAQIIDGQQRLTTLTILFSVLRALLPPAMGENLTKRLYEKGDPLLNTQDRYRLTLRERDAAFFQEYIQREDGLVKLTGLDVQRISDSKRNIVCNARLFQERLAEIDPAERVRLTKYVLNCCFLVVVHTPDFDSAYRIFSVLNDRGLDLSPTDVLKAEILGTIAPDKRHLYVDKWETVEESLGRDAFKELFAHLRTIERKVRAKDDFLTEFREHIIKRVNPQALIDETIIPLAEAYSILKGAAYAGRVQGESINHTLRWLGRIDNADWVPPAMLFFYLHGNDPLVLDRFLRDLERLAVGLSILRSNINGRANRYGKLLAAIEQGDDLFDSSSPLQLTADERADILRKLDDQDAYHDGSTRYVLLRLDEALAQGRATYDFTTISIEHVLPQNPRSDSLWMEWFHSDKLRERYTHRLGNLVLLPRRKNSQARNFDFAHKKIKYFSSEGGVSPFALTTQVLAQSSWTPAVVDQRQRQLLAVLKSLWRL